MKRRDFVRLSGISGVAGLTALSGIIAPRDVLAAEKTLAGGVYYTKDAPGRWSKKIAGHIPNIEIEKKADHVNVKVVTSHEMLKYEHYITKHVLLNENYEYIDEKMFDPLTELAPVSEYKLEGYKGRLNVLSVCNKHDTWLDFVDV